MDRSSTRHTTGRRLLLAVVLVVPVLTLGGLVRAAGDDGPAEPRAIGVPSAQAVPSSASSPAAAASPQAPAPDGSARDSAARDGAAPDGESSASVPGQTADRPAAASAEPGPASPPGSPPFASPPLAPPPPGSVPSLPTPVDGTAEGQAAAAAALAAVAAAGARAGGTVEAVVLGPDGREQLATPGAGVPAWTASLVKTFVVQQLLDPDGGRQPVAPADLRLLERALTVSDDAAMNALWVRFDGPELVTEAATEFGLTGTAAPTDTSQWGEATTTARDYAEFLHRLRFGLDEAALATVTGWLQSTTDRAADGFDQTFGLLSPAVDTGGPVAAKQGWMCCIDGRRQLHSAGSLVDGRTVVLLGDFPVSTSWAAARTALDQAATAVVAAP
jgi:hypothetical protein